MRLDLLAAVLVMLAPAAQAGSPDDPDLRDPEGDVGQYPCSPAIDLVAFWADWGAAALHVGYRFQDLGPIAEYGALQDADGRCFYSHVDFVLEVNGSTIEDSIYVDHIDSPVFASGWRAYFHETRTDLAIEVDMAASTFELTLPYGLIGKPVPGDRFGAFRMQFVSDLGGQALPRDVDWIPDGGEACDCWITYAPATTEPGPAAPQPKEAHAPAPHGMLALAAAGVLAGRRQA